MNPLQKAAVRRKAIYFAAILALFTVSIFYRGLEAQAGYVWIPFGRDDRVAAANPVSGGADWLARQSILSQAKRLEIRELELGEPDLTGTAARLGLVGSRGFVVTALWQMALDRQKRNDFHEMDQLIKQIVALQPHFSVPWIFQSWNIAYNVSVEMHSLGDMYFYIARGIELLAEGERRNRRSPDMRYKIAFYYQNKFGVSDQVQTLRCLYQLSCIAPADRNTDKGRTLVNNDGLVNMEGFRDFCEKHPTLVRRLRGEERVERDKKLGVNEGLRCRRPEDVIRFLADNKSVPSRYKPNGTEFAAPDKQFPALPPQFNDTEAHPGSPFDDAFSGFLAARAWYTYANTLVPPNPTDDRGNPIPAGYLKPGEYDPFKYRLPKEPMLIIFRQGPPRAQSYQAEMMEKDGWYDVSGWEVDGGVDDANAWFTENGRKPATPVVIGNNRPWSEEAWKKAYDLWARHGADYALEVPRNRLDQWRADAGVPPGATDDAVQVPPEPVGEQAENADYVRRWRAAQWLRGYHQNRQLTNFPYYLASAGAEQKPATVQARKTLWQAEQARRLGQNVEAVKLYKQGLEEWRQVLLDNPTFHRPERSTKVEEDTYEYELEYLRLIARTDAAVRAKAREEYVKLYAKDVRAARAVVPGLDALPAPTEVPEAIRDDWYAEVAEKEFSPFRGLMPENLPPSDGRANTPWIRNEAKDTVLSRQGVTRRVPGEQPPAGGEPKP